MANRADFEYVAFTGEPNIVFIRDLNIGNKSVTNDAEAVVKEVNMLFPGKRIVYQDSQGDWSELLHDCRCFEGFAPYNGLTPD